MLLAVDLPVNTFMQIDKFSATDRKELNARVCSSVLVGEGGTGGQKFGGPGASHGGLYALQVTLGEVKHELGS
ncbi:unnamed protein product [Sphagnum jensenii]|uniref:Uncharacterized protein n=1 Tax=Sphagnum jensenii TaxID=128206 RepID=A0ABP1AW34_9BRYO